LNEIEFEDNEVRLPMANFFGLVHSKVIEYAEKMKNELRRTYFVTPKNYIDFVKAFQELLEEKRTETNNLISKYTVGLEKLGEATLSVEELRGDLDVKRLEMQQKKKARERSK